MDMDPPCHGEGTVATDLCSTQDFSHQLPTNLLAAIFTWMEQPSVIAVAATCTRWRAIAVTLPTYYAHVSVKANALPTAKAYEDEIEAFPAKLADACVCARRISVAIEIVIIDGAFQFDDLFYDTMTEWVRYLAGTFVLQPLPSALPSVCRLKMALPPDCCSYTMAQLCYPAPALTDFSLSFGGHPDTACPGEFESLPWNLFLWHSPQLRTVRLYEVELAASPILGLTLARDVDLAWIVLPSDLRIEKIGSIFPSVRSLKLGLGEDDAHALSHGPAPPLHIALFTHLTLLDFFVDQPLGGLERLLQDRRIHEVRASFDLLKCPDLLVSLFKHLDGSLSASLWTVRGRAEGDYHSKIDFHYVLELERQSTGLRRVLRIWPGHELPAALAVVRDTLAPRISAMSIAVHLFTTVFSVLTDLPQLVITTILYPDDHPSLDFPPHNRV